MASLSSNHILYACVAYNNTILTDHISSDASSASTISSLTQLALRKISHDQAAQVQTYAHGNSYIHFIANGRGGQGGGGAIASATAAPASTGLAAPSSSSSASSSGLTYLTVASADAGRRIPFSFLSELKADFHRRFPAESTDFAGMPAYGAASYNGSLGALLQAHNSSSKDTFRVVHADIEGARDVMSDNIERVLERGERIDLLVDKTDRLGGSARDFRLRSRGLRRRLWWKNIKLMALIVVILIVLIYLFVGFGCGFPAWSNCIHH